MAAFTLARRVAVRLGSASGFTSTMCADMVECLDPSGLLAVASRTTNRRQPADLWHSSSIHRSVSQSSHPSEMQGRAGGIYPRRPNTAKTRAGSLFFCVSTKYSNVVSATEMTVAALGACRRSTGILRVREYAKRHRACVRRCCRGRCGVPSLSHGEQERCSRFACHAAR